MNNFDLIIFDCDGTLVDSEYLNNKALSDLLCEYGLPQYDVAYALENFVGKTVSNILLMIQMETGFSFPKDTVSRYIENARRLQKTHLKPIPDAMEVVKNCARHLKVCVGSNGERSNVLESLRLTGFLDVFSDETVFTKVQVPNGKPAPDLFLFAAGKMGAAPRRCLVIEDSESGVIAGKEAGMDVWGFTGVCPDKKRAEISLKNAGADRVIEHLIHIPSLLGI
ncbi:MAG: HAD family phosphatase [Rhodospirillales bacterium]|nr:HAD family phosphatase [Alphaproteobacteria bacterium]USO04422.1 MAG: HAD family phosphatase [Rhodospirillales bacterium]